MDAPRVLVRRASVDDTASVFALVEEYYNAVAVVMRDDRATILVDYVRSPQGGVWLAVSDSEPVGCILYHPLPTGDRAGEVKRLYVRPAFRRAGIAQRLLDALEGFARERGDDLLYLDTNDSLEAAVAFYERNGYVRCERYNDNPQATIFMRKRLSS